MHKLTFTLVAFLTLPAFAADKVVTVKFEDLLGMTTKQGEKLDAKLFSFGPAVAGAEEDTSQASSSGFGKSKEESCKWALLASFVKLQNNAKGRNKKVVGLRTYAGATEGAAANNLVCLAGAVVVRSTVKAGYK